MSKDLNYIADLERENRTIKSVLYCTKRSCNNCGKVNCENFQRQRIDCCGLWVSYKDYITELENQIADIKANCDLAIEGRDIKIKELEQQIEKHKWNDIFLEDCASYDNKIAEEYTTLQEHIEKLETENAELKRDKEDLIFIRNQNAKYMCEDKDTLAKAKDLLKKMYYLYFDPCVTHKDLEKRDKLFEEVKQFIKE